MSVTDVAVTDTNAALHAARRTGWTPEPDTDETSQVLAALQWVLRPTPNLSGLTTLTSASGATPLDTPANLHQVTTTDLSRELTAWLSAGLTQPGT